LRPRKAEFDAIGAELICVLPMDRSRGDDFAKTRSGPYRVVCDLAGRASAMYGVSEQIIVHNEWVNSPSIFIIDRKGTVSYAHVGSSWNDRPEAEAIVSEAKKAAAK
jgi:peroxiredoxin